MLNSFSLILGFKGICFNLLQCTSPFPSFLSLNLIQIRLCQSTPCGQSCDNTLSLNRLGNYSTQLYKTVLVVTGTYWPELAGKKPVIQSISLYNSMLTGTRSQLPAHQALWSVDNYRSRQQRCWNYLPDVRLTTFL